MNSTQVSSPISSITQPLIVGITGASGICYGIRALELLRELRIESHLVISKSALQTLRHESALRQSDLLALADHHYPNADIGAAIASGSFRSLGMLVAPCSIKTLSEIASGVTSTLISRAADVILKERRRLVLMVRESPLHAGHLKSMLDLSHIGAIIAPPVPAFYTQPTSLDDVVTQSTARALDLFGLESERLKRWGG